MLHPALQGCIILIVEDEPLIALNIEQAFENTGAELTVTNVMDHAILLAEHDGLSAAIVDHAIGNDTSGSLYKRLSERGIPFIIHSGHEVPENDRRGGVVVPKPALPEELVATIEALLRPP